MPHMAASFVPALADDIFTSLAGNDFGTNEPALQLIPLIQHSIVLRSTSVQMLQEAGTNNDRNVPDTILAEIQSLNNDLMSWSSSLPSGWHEAQHLYQLLTTTWFLTHRIFLADLSIRCLQLLSQIDQAPTSRDDDIWGHVDLAQNAIDEICVRAPYNFGTDRPRLRKPAIPAPAKSAEKLTYLYHASTDYALLIASMVWTLPPFRQAGIEQARLECARACGLSKPRKQYPKVLIYLTAEERERYIEHRVGRHQKWLAITGLPCPFLALPGHSCRSSAQGPPAEA